MKIEEFRIQESRDGYSIQREFKISKATFKWFWPFPKVTIQKQWCGITKSGNNLDISNWRHAMPTFKTKQEAISEIERLCTPIVYHYPPFE